MATAGVNRMMLWTDLEGREVNGIWRLTKLVRPEGRMAWFEGTGRDGEPLMLSLTEALNDEEELLARLRAAAEIRHPNVVAIRDAQLAWVEDTPVVLAAMEPTEENLGDVLRERTLNAEETRMVMDALLGGLGAIHKKKLTHGRMEAASVLAMGETIKLRSDCLQIPGSAFATKAAEDMRCAARVVVQAMTRRIPSGENDPVLQLLPEPMARGLRKALGGNATVEEVATLAGARLSAVPASARPVPEVKTTVRVEPLPKPGPEKRADAPVTAKESPAVAEKPQAEEKAADKTEPAKAAPAKAAPQPASLKAAQEPAKAAESPDQMLGRSRLLFEDDEPDRIPRRSAPYVIGGAVVLVLITIFVLYGMLHRGSGSRPVAQQARAAGPAPGAPAAAVAAAKPPADVAAASAAPRAAAAAGPGWHVIVYTYNHRDQAQQKADALARRYGQLQPSVFSPHGRAPYLVTLGGTMSRSEAIDLRVRAIRMGLPKDTYARNYR